MASPRSANIKIILLGIASLIVIGTLLYSQAIVHQLLQRERDVAALYARSLQFIANRPTTISGDQTDYSFIFDEIIRSIDFPMVLSDANKQPIPQFGLSTRNIILDTTLTPAQQEASLRRIIEELDKENPPIRVMIQDSIILNHVHYGESELVTRLRWLPYIELIIGGMFILIGYIGFSYIKRSEQSNIWVGMAKETAHQLGTPLSSLMGWIEMLKSRTAESPEQLATISEMENDLGRLQKVTDRFSKIGSKPSLKQENIQSVISGVIHYFERRLPSKLGQGRQITLRIDEPGESVMASINRELFEWVIENLIKNAIDAMEEGSGSVTFLISTKGNTLFIDVKDTGKGIDMKLRKDIFRPGYSTKQRGWGLGLSLSKRIIETYHAGKLFVRESRIGKGTTFRIRLPL